MNARFAGQAAIVTGASSGIGRAIAERLAADGADLCLVAAPADASDLEAVVQTLEARATRVVSLAADVGDPDTATRAIAAVLDSFDRVDLVANNAGIAYFDEVLSAPLEHLDHTLHVNVRGMYLMAVEAARAMAQRDGGAIVCTASTAAFIGEEHQVTYNASKGAVAALARSLAIDLAPYAIRVNAVAPGWVRTRATAEIIEDAAEWSKHRSRIPLDRPADPAEIAAVVAFLLSADASYMTGAVVFCDGGLTAGYRYTDWGAVAQADAPRRARRWAG